MDHKKTSRLLVIIVESLLVFNCDQKLHPLNYEECLLACSLKLLENSWHLTFHLHDTDSFGASKCQRYHIYDLFMHSYYLNSLIHAGWKLVRIRYSLYDFYKNYAHEYIHFFDRLIQKFTNHKLIVKLDHFFYFSPNQDSVLGSKVAHLERVLYLATIHLIFYAVQLLMLNHGDDLAISCDFNLITFVIIKKYDFTHVLNLLYIFYD
jgi:hypothetical protein